MKNEWGEFLKNEDGIVGRLIKKYPFSDYIDLQLSNKEEVSTVMIYTSEPTKEEVENCGSSPILGKNSSGFCS